MGQAAVEYLSPAQVVERSADAVTVGTLANWRTQGKGPPFVKFGTRVRYALPDVIEWELKNKHANDNEKQ